MMRTHKRVELSRFPLEPFPGQPTQTRRWQEMWSQAAKFSHHALQTVVKLNSLRITSNRFICS